MFLLNRNWFEFICNLFCLLMTSRRLDSKLIGWDVIKQCFKLQWLLYYFPNFVTMFFCNMFDTCLYSNILAIFLFFSANIALNKTTYMSSTFSNFTSSNKAVDGQKTDLSYSGGQCAISTYQNMDIKQLNGGWTSRISAASVTLQSTLGRRIHHGVIKWI